MSYPFHFTWTRQLLTDLPTRSLVSSVMSGPVKLAFNISHHTISFFVYFDTKSFYVTEASLQFDIPLPQLPSILDYSMCHYCHIIFFFNALLSQWVLAYLLVSRPQTKMEQREISKAISGQVEFKWRWVPKEKEQRDASINEGKEPFTLWMQRVSIQPGFHEKQESSVLNLRMNVTCPRNTGQCWKTGTLCAWLKMATGLVVGCENRKDRKVHKQTPNLCAFVCLQKAHVQSLFWVQV